MHLTLEQRDGCMAVVLTEYGKKYFEELEDEKEKHGIESAVQYGLEHSLCNGWNWFNGNTVAMHGSYIISDDCEETESGNRYPAGNVYYNNYYATMDEIETLKEQGYFLLTQDVRWK